MKRFLLPFFISGILYGESIVGFLEDAKTNSFIDNAQVCDSSRCVTSDGSGMFIIDTNETVLHVKAHGYRPYSFERNSSKIHFMCPVKIQALYLTYWGANLKSKTFNRIMEMAEKTSVNAVIVDLKNEYGDILYDSGSQKAKRYGALKNKMVYDIDAFVDNFKRGDLYLIARIVVFKDERQATHTDYAIKRKGKIWRNHDNIAWVDPFDKRAWEYVLDLAVDAAKRGFDEINFDYIRFPARAGLELSQDNTMHNRTKAMGEFLDYAKNRLRPYGVFVSVDTFGNICWSKDDTNIGQTVEVFERHADYLCPMVYPSSFASGSFGRKHPSQHPYEVVYKSIDNIKDRIALKRVRPWIQAFKDYSARKLHYSDFEIKEQVRATEELGTNGWMMWSPSSRYALNYFKDDDGVVATAETKLNDNKN